MTEHTPSDSIGALAPLVDEVRRALYLYVLRARDDVGRDEAARAVGISRSLAAFHLDKLVEEGFLEAGYRRLSERRGPGAGRPSKMYRPSGRQVDVTVPPREYELAARVLLEAAGPRDERRRTAAAREVGRELARQAGAGRGSRRLLRVLEERGFQPTVEPDGVIRVGNCPFDALVDDYRETVCSLNLALLTGVAEGTRAPVTAVPDDPADGCCVAFVPRKRRAARPA